MEPVPLLHISTRLFSLPGVSFLSRVPFASPPSRFKLKACGWSSSHQRHMTKLNPSALTLLCFSSGLAMQGYNLLCVSNAAWGKDANQIFDSTKHNVGSCSLQGRAILLFCTFKAKREDKPEFDLWRCQSLLLLGHEQLLSVAARVRVLKAAYCVDVFIPLFSVSTIWEDKKLWGKICSIKQKVWIWENSTLSSK